MKKIISLLLCVAMCCLLLVGCADEPIGADLESYEEYRKEDDRKPIELDFYIISETDGFSADGEVDEAEKNAIETVVREINAYLSSLYKTTLKIHFISEKDYLEKVRTGVAATGADRADIVFINSKSLFDELYDAKALVALDRYYDGKDFGRLNSPEMIASALLDATVAPDGYKYVVPNNRVVGEYSYYLVNRAIARYFCISDLDLNTMRYEVNPIPELIIEYREAIASAYVDTLALMGMYAGIEISPESYDQPYLIEQCDEMMDAIKSMVSDEDSENPFTQWVIAKAAEVEGNEKAIEDLLKTVSAKDEAALEALKATAEYQALEAKQTELKPFKDRYYAIIDVISGIEKAESAYTALAASSEYASYVDNYNAYIEFLEFRPVYEQLVADNAEALIAAGFDPADAYLTHEDIGTDYYDRLEYLDEYACIASVPYIDAEEAHSSSFAIIAQDGTDAANLEHAKRCMEVIYALDTDSQFKNLLQYGVRNTHYVDKEIFIDLDGNILGDNDDGTFEKDGKVYAVTVEGRIYALDENGEIPADAVSLGKALKVTQVSLLNPIYTMNMEYTGSVFNAHYNDYDADDANVWNALLAYAAKVQNKEAQVG